MSYSYVSNLRLTNPYAFTAEDSLSFFDEYGNSIVKDMVQKLGYLKYGDNESDTDILKTAIYIYKELRFKTTNVLYSKLANYRFVDLGCGFTPRALWVNYINKEYVGADFPFIVEKMEPIVQQMIPNTYGKTIKFKVADVTNPKTLMDAVGNDERPLFVSTEGLLMYLTDSELNALMDNIQLLFKDRAGYWVTIDPDIRKCTLEILKALCSDVSSLEKILMGQKEKSSGFMNEHQDFPIYNNQLYKNSNITSCFEKKGFTSSKIPVTSLIDKLNSVDNLPADVQEKIYDVLSNQFIYILKKGHDENLPKPSSMMNAVFNVDSHCSFNQLTLTLTGRLDTLTSDTLLNEFQKLKSVYEYDSIIINCSKLDYVSSAGLRVFLIMFKTINNKRKFHLTNCNQTILEVLKTTGMDTILSCNPFAAS